MSAPDLGHRGSLAKGHSAKRKKGFEPLREKKEKKKNEIAAGAHQNGLPLPGELLRSQRKGRNEESREKRDGAPFLREKLKTFF